LSRGQLSIAFAQNIYNIIDNIKKALSILYEFEIGFRILPKISLFLRETHLPAVGRSEFFIKSKSENQLAFSIFEL